jgi:hypothetical protein
LLFHCREDLTRDRVLLEITLAFFLACQAGLGESAHLPRVIDEEDVVVLQDEIVR